MTRGYADRYGIEVIGAAIPSLSTQGAGLRGRDGRPGRHDQADRRQHRLPREGAGAKLERAIADEAGAKVGGELWTDTLLEPDGSDRATYVEAMRVEHGSSPTASPTDATTARRRWADEPRLRSGARGRRRTDAAEDDVVGADAVVDPLAEVVDSPARDARR